MGLPPTSRTAGAGVPARGPEFFCGGWSHPTSSHGSGVAAITLMSLEDLPGKDFLCPQPKGHTRHLLEVETIE